MLAGQVVRGRIDAVYAEDVDGERFLVVDWKTNRAADGRPAPARDLPARLGRAARRPARAGARGVPLRPHRQTVEPDDLPGRDELERIVSG